MERKCLLPVTEFNPSINFTHLRGDTWTVVHFREGVSGDFETFRTYAYG